jgi:polysaccharide chain length determinant protein (PEP-CTERM system associated)
MMINTTQQQRMEALLGYARCVLRHKWRIAVSILALMLLLLAVVADLPNMYEATTTILVDPQQVPERYVTAAVNSDPAARLNTITQQVLSRTRLQEIIDKFHLYATKRKGTDAMELIEIMREHITIQVRQGTGSQLSTFTITFEDNDPVITARVADELASTFIQWNVDSREQQVSGTKDFLASELQTAKVNLEQQENRLRQFKTSHLGESPDQTTNNVQAISGLSAALQANGDAISRLEQEKLLLTRLPQSAQTPGAVNPDPMLTQRGRLEHEKRQLETRLHDLRENYSENYPDVVAARRRLDEVTAELSAITRRSETSTTSGTEEVSATTVRLELIEKELARLKGEQKKIQSQMATYQARVDAAPIREQQLLELTRNYDVSKQHYQALLDKSFNIEMAASLEEKQKGERFTVLDPARVPEKPIKPRRKLLIPLAMLLSCAIPVTIPVVREVLSTKLNTEADVKSLGARVVASITTIHSQADRVRIRRNAMLSVLICAVLVFFVAQLLWQMRPLL